METNIVLTKENINIHDFERVCRTCLSTVDLQPISEVLDSEHFPVEIALSKYTQVQFDPSDKLPKQICSKCVQNLNNSYNFLLNCDTVNSSLKKCLGRHESNLQTNVYLPKEIEYVNCEIKQEPAEFDLSEVETIQPSVVPPHSENEILVNMDHDVKEEALDNSEGENYSDNFDGEFSGRKSRKRNTEREMSLDVKRKMLSKSGKSLDLTSNFLSTAKTQPSTSKETLLSISDTIERVIREISRNISDEKTDNKKNLLDEVSRKTETNTKNIGLRKCTDVPVSMEDDTHELEDLGRKGRRRCNLCYEKIKAEIGRLEALRKCPQTTYKCTTCLKYFCLHCFFEKHNANVKN